MTEPNAEPHEPRHDTPELEVLKEFLNSYGKPILTAVLAVAIVVTGSHLLRARKGARLARSSEALATARSAADLESIISDYAKAPSAPLALLALAKNHYDAGSYNIAMSKYDQFLSDYPEHAMALSAELGKIHCTEGAGDEASIQSALSQYDAFLAAHGDSYMAPLATFGKARCLKASGKLAEARQVYEDFNLSNEETPWQAHVDDQLETLDKEIKRARIRVLSPATPGTVTDAPVPVDAVTPKGEPEPVLQVPAVVPPETKVVVVKDAPVGEKPDMTAPTQAETPAAAPAEKVEKPDVPAAPTEAAEEAIEAAAPEAKTEEAAEPIAPEAKGGAAGE